MQLTGSLTSVAAISMVSTIPNPGLRTSKRALGGSFKRQLPVPSFGLIQPLVSVDSNLGSERLGQNQDIADDGRVGTGSNKVLVKTLASTSV